MNKKELSHLDINVFHEKLNNGLNIYVAPNDKVNNIYVTFSTNYGSNQSEFIPIGKSKMTKVPLGIAHFLEHKMFEQEDGDDPFKFFGERGSDANANTNNFKTTYLFSGPEFFEENMNYLLDYVQSPYFTDTNVEKEKGIIEQEIKMYQDDPYSNLYEKILFNSLINNPAKDPVIGNLESIRAITKEDLYTCYNTFYQPSNMFVVVTGNVDAKEAIEIIKSNQEKKTFSNEFSIKLKQYKEPDKVETEEEVIKMNVSIPKVAVNYKVNYNKLKTVGRRKALFYLMLFFDIKYGSTSLFNEKLREDGVISDQLDLLQTDVDSHVICTIMGETKEKDLLIKKIKEELNNLTITPEELERKKKTLISSLIYITDNIFRLNNRITLDINRFDGVIYDRYEEIKSLNIKEMKSLLKEIDFSNNNVVIIDSKN